MWKQHFCSWLKGKALRHMGCKPHFCSGHLPCDMQASPASEDLGRTQSSFLVTLGLFWGSRHACPTWLRYILCTVCADVSLLTRDSHTCESAPGNQLRYSAEQSFPLRVWLGLIPVVSCQTCNLLSGAIQPWMGTIPHAVVGKLIFHGKPGGMSIWPDPGREKPGFPCKELVWSERYLY